MKEVWITDLSSGPPTYNKRTRKDILQGDLVSLYLVVVVILFTLKTMLFIAFTKVISGLLLTQWSHLMDLGKYITP